MVVTWCNSRSARCVWNMLSLYYSSCRLVCEGHPVIPSPVFYLRAKFPGIWISPLPASSSSVGHLPGLHSLPHWRLYPLNLTVIVPIKSYSLILQLKLSGGFRFVDCLRVLMWGCEEPGLTCDIWVLFDGMSTGCCSICWQSEHQ